MRKRESEGVAYIMYCIPGNFEWSKYSYISYEALMCGGKNNEIYNIRN